MNILICAQQGHVPYRPLLLPLDFVKDPASMIVKGVLDICMRCDVVYFHDEFKDWKEEDVATHFRNLNKSDKQETLW